MKTPLPDIPLLKLTHAKKETPYAPYLMHGYQLEGWEAVDRYAMMNVAVWHAADSEAEYIQASEVDRLKMIAYALLRRCEFLACTNSDLMAGLPVRFP